MHVVTKNTFKGGYNSLCVSNLAPDNSAGIPNSSEAQDPTLQYASSSHYPHHHLHQQQHYPVMGHSDFSNYGPIYGGHTGYSNYAKYRANPYQRPSPPLTHSSSCKSIKISINKTILIFYEKKFHFHFCSH